MLLCLNFVDVYQELLLSVVGGDKIDPSSLKVYFLDIDGKYLEKLNETKLMTTSDLKLQAYFKPPNKPFKVMISGKNFVFRGKRQRKEEILVITLLCYSKADLKTYLAGLNWLFLCTMLLIERISIFSVRYNQILD